MIEGDPGTLSNAEGNSREDYMRPNVSERYIEGVLDTLLGAGATSTGEVEVYLNVSEGYRESATIETELQFSHGCRLEVDLTFEFVEDNPQWLAYSFHFMAGDNRCVFRYDNAPHHRGLLHFPHHKHEGEDERVIGCPEPTARTVASEVWAYLRRLAD